MDPQTEKELRWRFWKANIIITVGVLLVYISTWPSLEGRPLWSESLRTVGLSAGIFVLENFILFEMGVGSCITMRLPGSEIEGK